MERKAFTLYEMALVLVIIGLISAMTMKGISMMRLAEFKREATRVERIRIALALFENRYGRLPGDRVNEGIIRNNTAHEARKELISTGFLTSGDFIVSFDPPGTDATIWNFERCTVDTAHRNFFNTQDNDVDDINDDVLGRGGVCVVRCETNTPTPDMVDASNPTRCTYGNSQGKTSYGMVGGYEIHYDEGTLNDGVGRTTAEETNPYPQKDLLRDWVLGDDAGLPFSGTDGGKANIRYLINVWSK